MGLNVYSIDQYRATFYKPTLALSGNRNAYLAAVQQSGRTVQDASIAPPLVTISTLSSANSTRASISDQNGAPQRSRIIPNSELQDVLRFPGQKLVFIDSCFSGGLQGKQMGSVDNESLINSLKDDSSVVFTSSSKTERSWEHEPARMGLFTHVLLEGLSGKADANKDGKITIQELGDYVKRTVPGMRDGQNPYYLAPPGYRDFVVAELK